MTRIVFKDGATLFSTISLLDLYVIGQAVKAKQGLFFMHLSTAEGYEVVREASHIDDEQTYGQAILDSVRDTSIPASA